MRKRHLDQLEGPVTPRARVLRWLAEAHAFPTLSHYVEWLLRQPPTSWPLASLPAQAAAHARRATRGRPLHEITRAVGDSVAETAFQVEVIMLLNAVTDDRHRLAALRCQLRVAEMVLLAQEPDSNDGGGPPAAMGMPSVGERVDGWRTAVEMEWEDLACAEEARRLLEERYLDGHSVLFPLTAERWAAVRQASSDLARQAADVLEPISTEKGARDVDAMTLATQLADTARAATLGLLGDSRGARAIAARGLRGMSLVRP
jgi:hypothetical protein